jgi:hypothetical protein
VGFENLANRFYNEQFVLRQREGAAVTVVRICGFSNSVNLGGFHGQRKKLIATIFIVLGVLAQAQAVRPRPATKRRRRGREFCCSRTVASNSGTTR